MRVDVVRPFDYSPDGCGIVHVLAGVQELPQKWGDLALSEGWARPVEPDAAARKPAADPKTATPAAEGKSPKITATKSAKKRSRGGK